MKEKKDNKTLNNKKIKKISLKERFQKYKGKNLAKEFEWDEPVGRELW